eukprot:m.145235 g.145235  ORF g.145235 m.145235 type:complete len:165 (+) comp14138_c1_seq6:608-1102(+)
MHPKGNGKGVGVLIRNYNAPPASKKPPDGEDKFPLGSPSSWSFFKQELSSFWRLALPISVSTLFQFAVSFISFAYIGHLGATELAGASLASTIYSIATMAIYGGATAMNTLVSQALGADNKQLVGAWLQVCFNKKGGRVRERGSLCLLFLQVMVWVWYGCLNET